jgi:hypothetical protein
MNYNRGCERVLLNDIKLIVHRYVHRYCYLQVIENYRFHYRFDNSDRIYCKSIDFWFNSRVLDLTGLKYFSFSFIDLMFLT